MATYAAKVRSTAVDNATIRLNATGEISAGGIMEPFSAGTKGGAPSVFYVDGNVVSSGNGLGWLSAVKTLSEGLVMAHAYMSTSGNKAWAHRATVYCCGDSLNEDLVILAERSDIIGVGTSNVSDRCELVGYHVPVTTDCFGTRWYNMRFRNESSANLWTLTDVSNGIKFLGCTFTALTYAVPYAINATAMGYLEINGCDWDSPINMYSSAAISLGNGDAANTIIRNNLIVGARGVLTGASTTVAAGGIYIDNNVLHCSGVIIQDASNLAYVTRNRGTTEISEGDPSHMWDGDAARWCDNIFTGSGGTSDQVPYVSES